MTCRRLAIPGLALMLGGMAPPISAAPPTLTGLFPAGASRGQTVEVTASGTFERWPVQAWTSHPGLTITMAEDKGKLRVAVDPVAPLGTAWIRLYDAQGASDLRSFRIGTFPEVTEVEPKDGASNPKAIESLPVVVNGRLGKRGDVDTFAVSLKAGQTLIASLEAQRLGSPMDGVLQVVSSDGFVLRQAEDDFGLDPLAVFEAPADGTYTVRSFAFPATPDQSIAFAGGDAFVYRLTMTVGPFADHVVPLAVSPDQPVVKALGWNLDPTTTTLPMTAGASPGLAVAGHTRLGSTFAIPVVGHPSRVEPEGDGPHDLPVPSSVTGQIAREDEVDRYRLAATKGRAIRIRVVARTLGSSLDAALRVSDEAGKVLVDQDDSGRSRDPELTFTPPADGVYLLTIRDLIGRGGPRSYYRIDAGEVVPDVELTLGSDRLTLAPGKSTTLVVAVGRKDGFDRPVRLELSDLPEGVTATAATSEPKGDSSKSVTLTIHASAEARAGHSRVAVIGCPEGPGEGRPRIASLAIAGQDASTNRAWLTVVEP